MDITARARLIEPYMVEARRRLHRRPELGFEEHESSDFVAQELEKAGYAVRRLSPTGVLGELAGASNGKRVLLRADMDALPVEEESGLAYASERPGVMHACGHDMHTAMLLGAARLIAEERAALRGSVRLLFQPAEETGRGARKMIAQGVLEGVDACFAEHIAPMVPVGAVFTGAGQLMAGAGTFRITVQGKACHGAMPHQGADALLAAARIVTALQTIVSRETAPLAPLVITVGTFRAGDRYNVVAGEAVLEGTVRALDGALLMRMGEDIARVASSTAAAHRCTAETSYAKTCESLVTDAALTETLRRAARKVIAAPELLINMQPEMGAEDFSDISALRKSAFAAIGAGGEFPLHSGRLNVDERALSTGAALYAQFAFDYLLE